MKIKTLAAIVMAGGKFPCGAVVDVPAEKAAILIGKKKAVEVQGSDAAAEKAAAEKAAAEKAAAEKAAAEANMQKK